MNLAAEPDQSKAEPSLSMALAPVATLVLGLALNLVLFEGTPHIPLILAAAVAAFLGKRLRWTWKEMEQGIVQGISVGMAAILILMVVGMLIGTWILAGVVPLMIDVGLRLLNPSIFLLAACVICCVVSLATGSSWTTAGTVGVALMGVGKGLEVPLPMVAGAIVSGAYFGDKISPLSDSTNLAPAVAGSELFEHIRHMLYTTVPALVLGLIFYAILGLFYVNPALDPGRIEGIRSLLQQTFHLSPILWLAPLSVIGMVYFRLPALPGLLLGSVLGGALAMGVQGVSLGQVLAVAQEGYTFEADAASLAQPVSEEVFTSVKDLLTRGGMMSMMSTVALVLCALSFGGVMERAGFLRVLAAGILGFARSTGSLIAATVMTCMGMNVIAPDQYLSIIVPGRMYQDAFRQRGLHPKNLSRCLEDGGTLSSPLIPWNTCGAYMTTTLGVGSFYYLPFAVMNWMTPIISIFLGFMGWTIVKAVMEAKGSPSRIP